MTATIQAQRVRRVSSRSQAAGFRDQSSCDWAGKTHLWGSPASYMYLCTSCLPLWSSCGRAANGGTERDLAQGFFSFGPFFYHRVLLSCIHTVSRLLFFFLASSAPSLTESLALQLEVIAAIQASPPIEKAPREKNPSYRHAKVGGGPPSTSGRSSRCVPCALRWAECGMWWVCVCVVGDLTCQPKTDRLSLLPPFPLSDPIACGIDPVPAHHSGAWVPDGSRGFQARLSIYLLHYSPRIGVSGVTCTRCLAGRARIGALLTRLWSRSGKGSDDRRSERRSCVRVVN
ncbi:hypothetical protein EV126DRAFT_107954 [Verticillium dahliae]|nr:hypothetical protein EV126DRAFT_107954 [Verticillium dahliae]